MRTCVFLLIVTLSFFSIGPAIQQTLSASVPATQPAVTDVEDSDLFFQKAMARKPQQRNFNQEVAALLAKMTTAEKIGQMTQLEIGMVTKGDGDK
jgi:hypothetical protein